MDSTQRPLQEMFEKSSQEHVLETVLSKAICELLKLHGTQMNKSQMARVQRSIRSGDLQNLKIPLTKKQQKLVGNKKLDLASLSSDTLERLHRETWSRFEPNIPAKLLAIADSISSVLERGVKKRIAVELRVRRKQETNFQKRLRRRWRRPLDLLQTLVFIAVEAGENASNDLRSRRPQHTRSVLFRLHARACQVAHEIVALLQSGFADGAHARWRTLHELAVTAFFIAEHGDAVAQRYLRHHGIETFKAAEQFQKYCHRLGYTSLTNRQFAAVARRRERLIQRFGKSFSTDYGWADSIIQNGRPTFRDIEERVQLDHMRPHYKLACNNVHAGAKGAFERLGLYDHEADVLLAGPSSIGLADPGHAAAISLSQITTCLLLVEPSLDNFVVIRLLDRLAKQVGQDFLRVQNAAEAAAVP